MWFYAYMPIGFFEDLRDTQPSDVRILGLDVGKKTIGLAVYEPLTGVITPCETIKRTKFTRDLQKLSDVIQSYEIGGYVVGLPLSDNGAENPACQRIRDFVGELVRYPKIIGQDPWVAYVDEHLSTNEVDYFVDEYMDISKHKAKQKGIIDSLAAVKILKTVFD
jgi:putative Holliday junction resolvase